MHINITIPGGDELDQLLYKLANQIVELQRTVNEIKVTAAKIQMDLNLSPGAPEEATSLALSQMSDEAFDDVASKLVGSIGNEILSRLGKDLREEEPHAASIPNGRTAGAGCHRQDPAGPVRRDRCAEISEPADQ